ncbi:PP2C family protein-serine/threonine phosphatase [Larkinella sp. VNQ87]|uniref:PP2C family protein-serine/threonine phosphatase n=1 Tax=Larkinella sp. VNQ87 TaxID=3400921 RepID=UPI003BFD75A3
MNSMLIAGKTDVGQRRKDNQDTFISAPIWSETCALLAAIDGVGGYAGGDRAAAIAKESIEQYMATPTGDPLSMLREAVVFANNQINTQRQQNPQLGQMACVLTAVVADAQANRAYYVHVGDTRLYRFRQGALEKLTHDHSLVGIREDANELTEAEAMQHPRRNEILRDLGSLTHRVDDPDFLESGETGFEPGDQLLLCSDGLTDMITQAQITAVFNQKLSLEAQATELIRLANQQGGNDNITVVLAKNHSKPANAQSRTAPKIVASQVPAEPPVSPEKTANSTQLRKSGSNGIWVLLGLLFLAAIGGLVWYQYQPASLQNEESLDELTTGTAGQVVPIQTSRLDSLLRLAYGTPTRQLALPADTFRLDKPLLLTDSLLRIVGGPGLTVLLPADTAQASVALKITRSGPVHLENLLISGFKIGIETRPTTPIQLSNVYFRDVDQPIQAVVRQDTFRNVLFEVSVQNRPETPQPTRP